MIAMAPMRIAFLRAGLAALASSSVFAQQPTAPPLRFEVASIRPVGPHAFDASGVFGVLKTGGGIRGGPGTTDPERIAYSGVPLVRLLWIAYGMGAERTLAPKWSEEERYDINVKVPAGTTKEQMMVMLQNLLTERFGLQVHHQAKEVAGYDLVLGKGGLHLPTTEKPAPQGAGLAARHNVVTKEDGRLLATFHSFSAEDLASWTSMILSQEVPGSAYTTTPVVDKTGLPGEYDFVLDFNPRPLENQFGGSDLAGALEAQLGLKLEPHKEPIDVLVVDRLEKTPTQN
jgi:uncharacterized protein (TIGR03435 family)